MANILGNENNNLLEGTPQSDYLNGGTGLVSDFNKDMGQDILKGKDGADQLLIGSEEDSATNRPLGSTDDEAYGENGDDLLLGVKNYSNIYPIIDELRNAEKLPLAQWRDDYGGAAATSTIFKRIITGNLNVIGSKTYEGDYLNGGAGSDIFIKGYGDRVVIDASDIVWRLPEGVRSESFLVREGGKFTRTYSPNITTDGVTQFSGFDKQTLKEEDFADVKFTAETQLVRYGSKGEGERTAAVFAVNYPGIVMSEDGSTVVLRFPEGNVLIHRDGSYSFTLKEDGSAVLQGDAGYQYPTFSGYEGRVDQYLIGRDSQWLMDIESEIEAKVPGIGTRFALEVQEWLRQDLYPVVDYWRKQLIAADPTYIAYYQYMDVEGSGADRKTIAQNGVEYGLYYENGMETSPPNTQVDVSSAKIQYTAKIELKEPSAARTNPLIAGTRMPVATANLTEIESLLLLLPLGVSTLVKHFFRIR